MHLLIFRPTNTHRSSRVLCFEGQVPMTEEHLAQNGVVGLLGHRSFPTSVKGREVPLYNLHHAVPWILLLCNTAKHAR